MSWSFFFRSGECLQLAHFIMISWPQKSFPFLSKKEGTNFSAWNGDPKFGIQKGFLVKFGVTVISIALVMMFLGFIWSAILANCCLTMGVFFTVPKMLNCHLSQDLSFRPFSHSQPRLSFFGKKILPGSQADHEIRIYLGGGFKYFLFSPLPGDMIQFD